MPKSNPVGKEGTLMVDHLGISVPCIVVTVGKTLQKIPKQTFEQNEKKIKTI